MKHPDLPHPSTQRDTHLAWWMFLLLAILALILLSAGPAAQAITSPCPQPDLVAPWGTPLLGGEDALPLHWPIALPPGTELSFQYWILSQDWTLDATDPAHWSATNAILAAQP